MPGNYSAVEALRRCLNCNATFATLLEYFFHNDATGHGNDIGLARPEKESVNPREAKVTAKRSPVQCFCYDEHARCDYHELNAW